MWVNPIVNGVVQTYTYYDNNFHTGYYLYTGDFNGDGTTDILSWISSNGHVYINLVKNGVILSYSYFDDNFHAGSNVYLGDYNGDGTTDITTWKLNGTIWINPVSNGIILSNTWSESGFHEYAAAIIPGDYNGDGTDDLLFRNSNGQLWIHPVRYGVTYSHVIYQSSFHEDFPHLLTFNTDGNGIDDLFFWRTTSGRILNYRISIQKSDKLTKITLPTGGTATITYAPAPQVFGAIDPSKTDVANHKVADASPQNLVTKIEYDDCMNDGLPSNKIVTEYEYSSHLFYTGYPYERRDLGFEYIKKIDHATGAYTKTWYYQDKPYEGLIKKSELYDSSDNKYSVRELKYSNKDPGSGIKLVYKYAEYAYNYNGDDNEETKATYRVRYCEDPENPNEYFYDFHGNLLTVKNDGDFSTTEDDTVVVTEWSSNETKNIYVPKHITKTAKNISGSDSTASEIKLCYDDQAYDGAITNGLLTQKHIYTDGSNTITLTYAYDTSPCYGNLVAFKDGRANAGEYTGNTASYAYDNDYKTYLVAETNGEGHVTSIHYDSLMRQDYITDPNGESWYTGYDVFGRIVIKASPGDDISTLPTRQFAYGKAATSGGMITSPATIVSSIKHSGLYLTSWAFYDGLGRLIQTKSPQTEIFDKWVTTDYFYNASGKNYKTSVPYIPTSDGFWYSAPEMSQKFIENQYDSIGRVNRIVNTDGTASQTIYEKKRVISIDENGYMSSKEIDGTTIKECSYDTIYNGYNVPDSSSAYYWEQTKAAWNGVEITDKASDPNILIATATDMVGRKSDYTDADIGHWTYTYDKNGNLLSQTDAKNQILTFEYDKLNRVKNDSLKVNGVTIDSTHANVSYDRGSYASGAFDDDIDVVPGQKTLDVEGALRYDAGTYPGVALLDRMITYDYANRVSTISESGNSSSFAYDYTGTRIYKSENGINTYYFGSQYEEQHESGQPTKYISYYFQNGQRIAQRNYDGTTYEVLYYHTDHLGSAVRLTDTSGNPMQSIAYAPFGETVYYSGIKDPKYQYTGQELDAPSGLYYYGARYYSPDIGRFIQPDTILDGLNRYAYCSNNPMNYTDPTGNFGDYSNPAGPPTQYDNGMTTYSPYGSSSPLGGDGSINVGTQDAAINGASMNGSDSHPDYVDGNGDLHRYVSVERDNRIRYGQEPDMDYVNYGNAADYLASNPNYHLPGSARNINDAEIAAGRTPPIDGGDLAGRGGGPIVYAPQGSIEGGTTYIYPVGGPENHWCNVFVNNDEIADDGSPRSDLLLQGQVFFLNAITSPPYNATKTKNPPQNSKGYLFYIFNNPNLVQPQHIELYSMEENTLKVWRTTGAFNDPPTANPDNPVIYDGTGDILQQLQTWDRNIIDYWFVPSRPLN